VGAVPGGRLLTDEVPRTCARDDGLGAGPFDVEPFRELGRTLVVREVDRPVLVLGSTQAASTVDEERLENAGVRLARRRSGGGAVLVVPGSQVWADLWVPRHDALWSDDPRRMAVSVGAWWRSALALEAAVLHRGPSVPAWGDTLVCFAGVGPGEVLIGARKLVGLAQWRSRQGALVHGCVYRHWEPAPLLALLSLDEEPRRRLCADLVHSAVGLDEVGVATSWGEAELVAALPDGAPWAVLTAET
jgi:lipoate-protein ligase A